MKLNKLWNHLKNRFFVFVYGIVAVCAAFGWWGVLYPQLTWTSETYRIVTKEGVEQTYMESESKERQWNFDDTIYEDILNADSSQIRFRSKLFSEISEYWKRLQG